MNAIFFLALSMIPGQAPLAATTPVVDLHTVRGGPAISQSFVVANRSPSDLSIVHVQPSCGCLAPKLSSRTLKSGETATVDIKIGTLSQPEGDNLWTVRLFYREAGSNTDQTLDLQVKARLVREVAVEPAALRLSGKPGLSHEIRLMDRRSRPLQVSGVAAPSNLIRVATEGNWQRADLGWVLKVRVTLSEECPIGRHETVAQIFSSDPDYREIRVPITVMRADRQRYLASPMDVRLMLAPEVPTSTLVLIRDREGLPVEIEKAESDDPALTCKPTPGAQPTAAVRLDVTRGATPLRQSSLRIKIKAPAMGEIVVPVFCAAGK